MLTALKKLFSSHDRRLTILLSVALFLYFLLPNLYLWAAIDRFAEPLRAADPTLRMHYHYLTRLHQAIVHAGPIGHPFFFEHLADQSRYWIWEKFFSLLPAISKIPIALLDALLRGFSAVGIFLAMRWLMVFAAAPRHAAAWLAGLFTILFLTTTANAAPGLNWFLPVFLAGVVLATLGMKRGQSDARGLALFFAAEILFTIHPVYFAIGSAFVGLFWFWKIGRERNFKTVVFAGVWFLATVGLLVWLYAPFNKGPAELDTLIRNGLRPIRPIWDWLQSLRILLTIAALLLFERSRSKNSVERAPSLWLWGVFLLAPMVFGSNANLLTGTQLLAGHFIHFQDVALVPLAAGLVLAPPPRHRWLKIIGVALVLTVAYSIYLYFILPLVGGAWTVPLFECRYLAILIPYALFSLALLRVRPRWRPRATILCGTFLFAIATITFFWRFASPGLIEFQRRAAETKPLIQKLRTLPDGVVLADSFLSNQIALYTQNSVYWSPQGYVDSVTNDELKTRWQRAKIFFPPEAVPAEMITVIGESFNQDRPDPSVTANWQALLATAATFASSTLKSGDFAPEFRLDYLALDARIETVPPPLARYFTLITDAGPYRIYHFVKNP